MAVRLRLARDGRGLVLVQARAETGQVEADLTAARAQLARAGGLSGDALGKRLALVDQAGAHVQAASARLDRWPLGQLGAIPVLGRDVRVAEAVASSAADSIVASRRVVAAVSSIETRSLDHITIAQTSTALLQLSKALDAGREKVRATRPLFTAAEARARFLEQSAKASDSTAHAGQGPAWPPSSTARRARPATSWRCRTRLSCAAPGG